MTRNAKVNELAKVTAIPAALAKIAAPVKLVDSTKSQVVVRFRHLLTRFCKGLSSTVKMTRAAAQPVKVPLLQHLNP